jgi:hypothetical protein
MINKEVRELLSLLRPQMDEARRHMEEEILDMDPGLAVLALEADLQEYMTVHLGVGMEQVEEIITLVPRDDDDGRRNALLDLTALCVALDVNGLTGLMQAGGA